MNLTSVVKKKKNNAGPSFLDDFLPHFLRKDRFSSFSDDDDIIDNEKKQINIEFRCIDNKNNKNK